MSEVCFVCVSGNGESRARKIELERYLEREGVNDVTVTNSGTDVLEQQDSEGEEHRRFVGRADLIVGARAYSVRELGKMGYSGVFDFDKTLFGKDGGFEGTYASILRELRSRTGIR